MKIKSKLRLGFGFLFVIVLCFGVLSLYYISQISESAKVILKDNYNTLRYTREMRGILDKNDLPLSPSAITAFKSAFAKQENNVTEKGEFELTTAVRRLFEQVQNPVLTMQAKQLAVRSLRAKLGAIEQLNMVAIERKNNKAQESVKNATVLLSLTATLTFLILFSFSVNFPGFIADPLRQLASGIREIGEKNYDERLHFNKDDEFADVAIAFNNMAAQLQEWENSNLANILSDKQRIETIIEQMQDAIIGVNEKGKILFINTTAENVLNLKEQQLVGKPVMHFAQSNDLLNSIISTQPPQKPFKIVVDKTETFFQLDVREIIVPVVESVKDESQPLNIANRSAGKVYILRNVTEFTQRDEAKSNFIATISHELKTPISSIKMSLKLLKDGRVGTLNDEQLQLVQHITEDSERLLNIAGGLLDLSQVETGNIQMNLMPSHPADIVNYAVKAVKFQAEQKNIRLETVLDNSLPQVQVDTEKTAWVLVNFLSNALRYSYEGSKVVIEVRFRGTQMIFSVRDFGKGIEKQYQKRLFDRYFQVPTDGQNKSGSGLGLAISKTFIEAQNGQIGVESAIGEGSRFYFTLPTVS
ncbi:ATP-binding protein [Mucilaginibacter lacusdianchii]|uniref:ATP-binding protein n=1 Tax=Mucilaginibacter lacusdianchii TaxID=2684211 RepID=UPI00131AA25E|nr:ATP-binding protein [Mucilaginibacter sp. JXJ CY 39]